MNVVRFSAVKIFGVPLDNPEQYDSPKKTIDLVRAYGLEAEEVPAETTDITPFYWENRVFDYRLSREEPDGEAVINMLPRHDNSSAHILGSTAAGSVFAVETNRRNIRVPNDQEVFALAGPGPRFQGQMCLHEVIARV